MERLTRVRYGEKEGTEAPPSFYRRRPGPCSRSFSAEKPSEAHIQRVWSILLISATATVKVTEAHKTDTCGRRKLGVPGKSAFATSAALPACALMGVHENAAQSRRRGGGKHERLPKDNIGAFVYTATCGHNVKYPVPKLAKTASAYVTARLRRDVCFASAGALGSSLLLRY